MTGDQLLVVLADAPTAEFQPGDALISVGDRGHPLYVLEHGHLRVSNGSLELARLTAPGSIVGELGVLLDMEAVADVVAVEHTLVRRLHDADRLFETHPEFGRHLSVLLAQRLRRATSFLGDLTQQFADTPGTLGLVPSVLEHLLSGTVDEVDPGSEREPDSPY